MSISTVLKQALKENKTDNVLAQKKKIKEIMKKIDASLKKNKIKATLSLGGSAAKDTFIGNDFDVDIFVMFDYKKYLDQDISKILKKALKNLKPETIHGSRDYYHIDKRYEIVPVLRIKNPQDAVNVTDASPLHAAWIKKQVKKKPKLKQEIKLAKLFFKSSGIYGAESYIKGMSGHVTDILIIYYGSFEKAVQAIAKWKKSTEIDIEKHKSVLDIAKIQGPLTVVDPIQPNRNAAAAVNQKTYDKLKKIAKKFLKKPDIDFFKEKKINLEQIKKNYNLVLKISVLKGKTDIVGAKLMKGSEFFVNNLKKFEVEKNGWWWDKNKNCYYYIKTKCNKLPEYYEQKGPTKEYPVHVQRFKQKYKKTVMKKGAIYAKVKTPICNLDKYVLELSKKDYLKKKIRGIKIVK